MRWAAQSAAAGGYRVIAMDLFGDLDTHAASSRCEIISPAEQADPDKLGQSIARVSHQEQAAVVWVSGLRSEASRKDASLPLADEMLGELARTGLRTPETVPWSEKNRTTDARWLVKESNSSGGLGVRFYNRSQTRPVPADALLQRWIPGRALGLVAIADAHRVSLLGMTRSIYHRRGDLPFVYMGSRTLSNSDAIPWASMQSICERIASSRGLQGLFNLDWIHDRRGQWWLLEINERPSASCEVLERALRTTGVRTEDTSLMRMHLAALLSAHASSAHTVPNAADPDHRASNVHDIRRVVGNGHGSSSSHIKRIVYSRRDGRIQLSALARSWRKNTRIAPDAGRSFRVSLADIPADGTLVQRGQPIATLLLDSVLRGSSPTSTLRQAIRQLHEVVK